MGSYANYRLVIPIICSRCRFCNFISMEGEVWTTIPLGAYKITSEKSEGLSISDRSFSVAEEQT